MVARLGSVLLHMEQPRGQAEGRVSHQGSEALVQRVGPQPPGKGLVWGDAETEATTKGMFHS